MVFLLGRANPVPSEPIPPEGHYRTVLPAAEHGCAIVEEERTLVSPLNLALDPLVGPNQPIGHSKKSCIFGQDARCKPRSFLFLKIIDMFQ